MSGFNTPPGISAIDPTPFIQVSAPRGHRRRFGKHARVQMSGSFVDVSTARRAAKWCGKAGSMGLLLDQLFAFAIRKGFKPERTRK